MDTATLTAVTVGYYAQHTFLLLNSTNIYVEFSSQSFKTLKSIFLIFWSISDREKKLSHKSNVVGL
jgi:hypothetical protein